ncbi:hypothetical protein GGF39_003997 [Coemansia sp. RSA 1721]|nr:hypothetical protein GGF39_003997 [Coemansia sp. RSA 1721]
MLRTAAFSAIRRASARPSVAAKSVVFQVKYMRSQKTFYSLWSWLQPAKQEPGAGAGAAAAAAEPAGGTGDNSSAKARI